jgi:quinol monooxygenase YgiN
MIVVSVTSQIREGCLDEFLSACAEIRPLVLAEKGCLLYEHTQPISFPPGSSDPVDVNQVVLLEIWESDEALARHGQVPHGKAFANRVRHLRHSVTVKATRSLFR